MNKKIFVVLLLGVFMFSFTSATITTTLNSPTDESTFYDNLVTFNATGNTTSGYLENMSLWTNESGNWEVNETTDTFDYLIGDSESYQDETLFNNAAYTYTSNMIAIKSGIITSINMRYADVATISIKQDGLTLASKSLDSGGTGATTNGVFTYNINSYSDIIHEGAFQLYITGTYTTSKSSSLKSYSGDLFNFTNQYIPASSSTPRANIAYTEYNIIPNITFNQTITDDIAWNVKSCNSDGDCSFAPSNYTLFIDRVAPTINIISPTGTYGLIANGENLDLNFNVNDTNLDTCWYNYAGTNTTINCSENTTFTQLTNTDLNLTLYANDSIGNLNSQYTSWDYNIFEIETTYNEEAIEVSSNTFVYDFNTPYSIEEAYFTYNDTTYSTSISSLGGDEYKLTSTIQVPNIEVETNFIFFFTIQTSYDGSVNSTKYNQTVTILDVDKCSSYTNKLIDMSLFDEKTLESITGTMEFNLNILNPSDYSVVNNFTGEFETLHTGSICSSSLINESNFIYDLEIRYYKPDNETYFYVPEFYHIQKADVTTFPQTINLYDLNINESTEFTITYRDNDYVYAENNLIQVLRKYVSEDLYRVVEIPITSTEGSAVAHFDLNNYKYKFIITENGEIKNTFDNPTISCESEISGICEIDLKGEKESPLAESISDTNDFEYVPTLENDSVTITFSSPSGTNKEIKIEVIQSSPFTDDTLVCNKTILSASGVVSCAIDETIGDSDLEVRVYVDGILDSISSATIQEDLSGAYDGANYFIGALFLLMLIGMAVSSPQLMIWIGVFGLVILGFMFLLNVNTTSIITGGIIWLIIAAIIATMKINNKTEA